MRGLVSKHHDLRNCRVWTVRLSQGPDDTSSLVSRHHGLRVCHFGGPLGSTYSSNECESEEHTLTQMDCSLLTTLATSRVRQSVFHSLGCAHLRGGSQQMDEVSALFQNLREVMDTFPRKIPRIFCYFAQHRPEGPSVEQQCESPLRAWTVASLIHTLKKPLTKSTLTPTQQ